MKRILLVLFAFAFMAEGQTITEILETDIPRDSRAIINANFQQLLTYMWKNGTYTDVLAINPPAASPATGYLRVYAKTDYGICWKTSLGVETCAGAGGGGTGTPGGAYNTIQYNDGGVLGGHAGMTYNAGTSTATIANLTVSGTLTGSLTGNVSGTAASITGNLTGPITSVGMATTLANIPTATPMAGSLLATAIVAPVTPAAGLGSIYVDSTSKNVAVKDDAGVVKHGVQTKAPVANSFATGISDAGVVSVAQPTPADLAAGSLATAMTVGAGGSVAPLSETVGTVSANALNGVSLASLATGPLAITGTSGIPRAATATDMSIPVFAVATGPVNAYVATLSPAITSCVAGAQYRFEANLANTGSATVNFGCGAKTITKVAGGLSTVLAANDIRQYQIVDVVYDGSTYMQMQSTLGNSPAAVTDAVLGNSNLLNAGRMTAVSAAGTVTELAGITAAAGVITATSFAGPLTGAVTGNADTATAFAADPDPCPTGKFAIDQAANGTLTCDTPPTAGVGATVNLTDFEPTVATDTVTVKAGRARLGNYVPVEIAQGTAQFTAGTGNVKVFIDQNSNLVCHMATGIAATVGGSMACSNVASPIYPPNSIPIANLTVSAGPAVALTNDHRAFFSNRGISAASGISVVDAGGIASIGVDTAVVPQLAGTNAWTGSNDFSAATGFVANVETAGTTITTVSKNWIQAVTCTGTTAALNWDTIATLAPTAACSAGTTNSGLIRGLASFSNTDISQMQTHFMLPSDWTGAVDLRFKWQTTAIAGSVVWQAATLCVADAEVNDAAWNAASTVTDVAKGTTLQTNDATITGLTTTGCAAGELLHLKIFRDPAHASDDLAATADLIGVEVTTRRAQ